jgi:hypothetical protein
MWYLLCKCILPSGRDIARLTVGELEATLQAVSEDVVRLMPRAVVDQRLPTMHG